VCTIEIRSGSRVQVVDSVSGGLVSADSISLVAREGSYADSARVPQALSTNRIGLTVERSGVYRVVVTAIGYKPWVIENVHVRDGQCHVEPVELVARLQPL
jgi:hypothetical protein